MKTNLFLVILFISVSVFHIGCNNDDDECPNSSVPYMRLAIEQTSAISFDSIFLYNNNLTDSLYTGSSVPDVINIPLKLDADTTTINFDIKYNDSTNIKSDILVFIYNTEFKLNNLECGFITEFNLSTVTSTLNNVDSINISNYKVNSDIKNHVKIYF